MTWIIQSGTGTVSNGGRTVTNTAGFGDLIADVDLARSSGKFYVEFVATPFGFGGRPAFCISRNANRASHNPVSSDSAALSRNSTVYTAWHNPNSVATIFADNLCPAVEGDNIGLAIDYDAKRIYWRRNGTWQHSGNPAAGTGGIEFHTTGSYRLAVLVNPNGAAAITANFTAADQVYAAPSGYSAWEGSAPTTHALTANNLATGAPTTGTPALGQRHALTATALSTGAPSLGTPALSQIVALAASGVDAGTPTLDAPALTEIVPVFLRPTATEATGGWRTNTGGTDLQSAIDEATPDDLDWIASGPDPQGDTARLTLSLADGAVDPAGPVVIRLRAGRDGTAATNLALRLMQGAATAATRNLDDLPAMPTYYALTLTEGERGAIDWTQPVTVELEATT